MTSVKTEHVDYVTMKPEWQKCLDFATSEKAVHDQGVTYLPKLPTQDEDEYELYKINTPVFMFAQQAGRSMTGMIGRKESMVDGRDLIKTFLKSVDSNNNDLSSYQSGLVFRFLFTGRSATLTDVPYVKDNITVKQAEEQGIRPRWIYYTEMDILNWREERINNVNKLVFVVLRENVNEIDPSNEFDFKSVYNYRVLDLLDGDYRSRKYDNDGMEIPDSEVFPKQDGKRMSYIPIVIHGGITPINPPLNAIVDINKHHYMLGSPEMYGLLMSALVTAYFFGEDPESESFPSSVGPGRIIGSSDTDAKTGFREFTGAGMASVAAKLKKFEEAISSFAVQISSERANASATGSAIDYANATATLSGVVNLLENELETALKYAAAWDKVDPDKISLSMNKDFMPGTMSAQDVLAQLQLYMSRTISYETFYNNIARGELADPLKTSEEEMVDIENDIPPHLNGGDDNTDNL